MKRIIAMILVALLVFGSTAALAANYGKFKVVNANGGLNIRDEFGNDTGKNLYNGRTFTATQKKHFALGGLFYGIKDSHGDKYYVYSKYLKKIN